MRSRSERWSIWFVLVIAILYPCLGACPDSLTPCFSAGSGCDPLQGFQVATETSAQGTSPRLAGARSQSGLFGAHRAHPGCSLMALDVDRLSPRRAHTFRSPYCPAFGFPFGRIAVLARRGTRQLMKLCWILVSMRRCAIWFLACHLVLPLPWAAPPVCPSR